MALSSCLLGSHAQGLESFSRPQSGTLEDTLVATSFTFSTPTSPSILALTIQHRGQPRWFGLPGRREGLGAVFAKSPPVCSEGEKMGSQTKSKQQPVSVSEVLNQHREQGS